MGIRREHRNLSASGIVALFGTWCIAGCPSGQVGSAPVTDAVRVVVEGGREFIIVTYLRGHCFMTASVFLPITLNDRERTVEGRCQLVEAS